MTTLRLPTLSFVFLALGLCACSDDNTGLSSATTPDAATDGGLPADEQMLVGTYAFKEVVAILQETPGSPTPSPSLTSTLGLAEIRNDGHGHLAIEERFCHLEIGMSGSPVTVTIDDAFTRTIGPITGPLVRTDNATPTWHRAEVPTPVGAHLVDPVNDALPTTADDPRVFDQDADGKPGVTTHVGGIITGDIYNVRRERYAFDLSPGKDGKLGGLMNDHSESVTIGATNDFLLMPLAVTPDPDVNKSRVDMVRAAATLDCSALVRMAGTLFP